MKTKTIIANAALVLTLGIVYTGCKKETINPASPTSTTSTTTADNNTSEGANSAAEGAFTDIFKTMSDISSSSSMRSSCATITVDSLPFIGWPKTVTIDYGSSGCDGKKGKLKAVFTGKFGSFGTIITITADSNYSNGSNKINVGTHTIMTGLTDTAGNKTFTLSVANSRLTSGGKNVSWNTTKTVKWIEGDTTLDPMDDVYEITGSSTGTNAKGETFTSTITTPLRVATSCPWIESGVVTITTFNQKTRTIDYGNTGCDNKATVTTDSTTYNITL
jgi:hypothetical protein